MMGFPGIRGNQYPFPTYGITVSCEQEKRDIERTSSSSATMKASGIVKWVDLQG